MMAIGSSLGLWPASAWAIDGAGDKNVQRAIRTLLGDDVGLCHSADVALLSARTHAAATVLFGLKLVGEPALTALDIVGADVVEVAPAYDVAEITSLAAGHLAMEMLYLYCCK